MHLERSEDVFSQEPDCCSDENAHVLTLKTEDGGGGPFLVLVTTRWSFADESEVDLLARRLKAVLRRAELTHAQDEARESGEKKGGANERVA